MTKISNHEKKYDKVFMVSFSLKKKDLNSKLKYESIDEWDSVGHMTLIAGLEETFDITMDMDDIIDFSSYDHGKKLLKKYKIKI